MKLFLISQTENQGYDTFDSAVVCADVAESARSMCPSGSNSSPFGSYSWCSSPDQVDVKYIGEAADGMQSGVICSSFNSG